MTIIGGKCIVVINIYLKRHDTMITLISLNFIELVDIDLAIKHPKYIDQVRGIFILRKINM